MHKRLATTANWQPWSFSGFLHSGLFENVGLNVCEIAIQEDEPIDDFKTLQPTQWVEIKAEESSSVNPSKFHSHLVWYRDLGARTTIEFMGTAKGGEK